MSFFKYFRLCLLSVVVVAFVVGPLFSATSGDKETSENTSGIGFYVLIAVILFGLVKIWSSRCPKCKKYFCFYEYKHEYLSRDVVSKKVKDDKLGTNLEHYAVGKRKHYEKCDKCGYESTYISDYKDKIDV